MIFVILLVMVLGGAALAVNAHQRKWANVVAIAFTVLATAGCAWLSQETKLIEAEFRGRQAERSAAGR